MTVRNFDHSKHLHGMLKEIRGWHLCYKFANEHQTVVGQGRLTKGLLPYTACSVKGVLSQIILYQR